MSCAKLIQQMAVQSMVNVDGHNQNVCIGQNVSSHPKHCSSNGIKLEHWAVKQETKITSSELLTCKKALSRAGSC